MFTRQDITLDTTQPALVVQHGNTCKKHFYLNERGMTLGSARGCDIQLASQDVSGVHCIITRSSTGLLVRDCCSRLGTKVNGTKVTEAPLNNGDLLQVGLFVFEVSLSPVPSIEDTPVDHTNVYEKKIEELKKSHERLTLLAWHLRRRLLELKMAQAV
jgi:pSer/pThr/pTyr-binding forkhead associated (FHA) protein